MLIRKIAFLIIISLIFALNSTNAQSTYLGVYNTEASNPGCDYCHETTISIWENSSHASAHPAESESYGYSCLQCHNTGWDSDLVNGGADEFVTENPGGTPDYITSAGWEFRENVQCEACHGPVGRADGYMDYDHQYRVTDFSGENCGACHEGAHHPYYSNWQESGHASGPPTWLVNRESFGSCFYCHFAQDFIAFIDNPEYDAVNFEIEGGDENLADISCVACHVSHGNDNPANLRDLPSGFEDKVICDVCHNVHTEVKDFNDTPHHTTSEVFSRGDEFGWRYPGEDYGQANSFHTLIADRCIACHMHTTPINYGTGEDAVTGHSFKPRVESCVECHPDYYDVVDINNEETKFDYRGTQTTVDGLIAQLEDLLANATAEDSTTNTFLQARYNLESAKAEGSRGIHNTKLVVKLLGDAIGRMDGSVTDIGDSEFVPAEYLLSQNYPNPFNPTTTINFIIPEAVDVRLTIYDALGKQVETLLNGEIRSGSHNITWNASGYTSGIYFYKLETNNFVSVKKMLLVK